MEVKRPVLWSLNIFINRVKRLFKLSFRRLFEWSRNRPCFMEFKRPFFNGV